MSAFTMNIIFAFITLYLLVRLTEPKLFSVPIFLSCRSFTRGRVRSQDGRVEAEDIIEPSVDKFYLQFILITPSIVQ